MSLRDHWKQDGKETPTVAPAWQHKDGSILYCTLHGVAPKPDAIGFATYGTVVPCYGRTPNQMRESGDIRAVPAPEPTGEFSYSGCCAATSEFYGQLNFDAEQSGAGVAFRTGLGDGIYPVYVRVIEVPGWGERVAEARIVFIEDEDEAGELMGTLMGAQQGPASGDTPS